MVENLELIREHESALVSRRGHPNGLGTEQMSQVNECIEVIPNIDDDNVENVYIEEDYYDAGPVGMSSSIHRPDVDDEAFRYELFNMMSDETIVEEFNDEINSRTSIS